MEKASFRREWHKELGLTSKKRYSVQNYVRLKEVVNMAIAINDVISLSQARANLSELADQVKAGAEKIVTKNGESYVAIIDAQRLDYYHQLERERIHLVLLNEVSRGIDDIAAGNVKDARTSLQAFKRQRK
ncbi:MAG: type II toxin-antitoxin system Phd/YefM family antitoxin [Candidatus Aquirickettsiella gammari]